MYVEIERRKPLILIADDEPAIAKSLADWLHKAGYAVACVYNGQQAIDYLDRAPLPDLLLCDVMMPVKDGFQVLNHLYETGRYHLIPFLMLTGRPADPDRFHGWTGNDGQAVGPERYIIKPVREEELLAKVRSLLSSR